MCGATHRQAELLCELAHALADRLDDVNDIAVLDGVIQQHDRAAALSRLDQIA